MSTVGSEQEYSRKKEELEARKSIARQREKERRASIRGQKKRTLKGKDGRQNKGCDSTLHIYTLGPRFQSIFVSHFNHRSHTEQVQSLVLFVCYL